MQDKGQARVAVQLDSRVTRDLRSRYVPVPDFCMLYFSCASPQKSMGAKSIYTSVGWGPIGISHITWPNVYVK